MLSICAESSTMSYSADIVYLHKGSREASEKLLKASPLGHFLVTIKYLSCEVSKLFSLYPRERIDTYVLFCSKCLLLIRDSTKSHLRVKLFPKDYFQCCFSSALSPPHYICPSENLFHLVKGFMSYLHSDEQTLVLLYRKDYHVQRQPRFAAPR